jgi:hypothetical protein
MKTLFRTLLFLALIVWLGAEIFFPIVAAVTFQTLMPNTHTAGAIVGHLLRILHFMGLASGMVALTLLALAPVWKIYKPRSVIAPMGLLIAMIGLTLYSQFGIIPAMERDRIAAGESIDAMAITDPNRLDFERLHHRSVQVEGAILMMGLATVVFLAKADAGRTRSLTV